MDKVTLRHLLATILEDLESVQKRIETLQRVIEGMLTEEDDDGRNHF